MPNPIFGHGPLTAAPTTETRHETPRPSQPDPVQLPVPARLRPPDESGRRASTGSGRRQPVAKHALFRRDYIAGHPGHRFAGLCKTAPANVCSRCYRSTASTRSVASRRFVASGYVLDPCASIRFSGWRKSYSDIAGSISPRPARQLCRGAGRPENVGVIGAPRSANASRNQSRTTRRRNRRIEERETPPIPHARRPRRAPAAQAKSSGAWRARAHRTNRGATRVREAGIGTGHGQRRYDPVSQTQFERDSSRPNQIVSLFYDSYEAWRRAA